MTFATMERLAETLTIRAIQHDGLMSDYMEEMVSGVRDLYRRYLCEFVRQERLPDSANTDVIPSSVE